jgi:D-alanyl-D-alanine carboxypeptidase (penicillin-binding protein 5/6)
MPAWAAAKPKIPPEVSVYSIEADTGLELYAHDADRVRPPASMIKLGMMLLVAEGLHAGQWTLDSPITATRHAEKMGGTQVYVKMGETYPLGTLMLAVAVASANDAAMAVAEGLWGSEEAYLEAVNKRLGELGMTHSVFRSVHGLPPDRGELPDETTARDMATLARECLKQPQVVSWTSTVRFKFRDEQAEFISTNKLLQQMDECDGLKTGYIRAAGFCITATAKRGDLRVVTVVMGHPDATARFRLAKQQLSDGLDTVRRGVVLTKDAVQTPAINVENGKADAVNVRVSDDIWATTRAEDWDRVQLVWDTPAKLAAPVTSGSEVGEVRAELDGKVLGRAKVVLTESVDQTTWIWRTEKMIRSFLNAV